MEPLNNHHKHLTNKKYLYVNYFAHMKNKLKHTQLKINTFCNNALP